MALRRQRKSRTNTRHPTQPHRDRRGYVPPDYHTFELGVDALGDPLARLSVLA